MQDVIYNAVPGLTGIGSVIFRDEEKWISDHKGDRHEFYRQKIAPYKGALEVWYQEHLTFRTDMMLIFLTAWTVFFPDTQLVFKIFGNLPDKPDYLM